MLKTGGRLEQPDNCSTELYTLMLTCWFIDPDTRPNFTAILDDLKSMETDPTRYVTPSAFTPSSAKTPKSRSLSSRLQSIITPSEHQAVDRLPSTSEGTFF